MPFGFGFTESSKSFFILFFIFSRDKKYILVRRRKRSKRGRQRRYSRTSFKLPPANMDISPVKTAPKKTSFQRTCRGLSVRIHKADCHWPIKNDVQGTRLSFHVQWLLAFLRVPNVKHGMENSSLGDGTILGAA